MEFFVILEVTIKAFTVILLLVRRLVFVIFLINMVSLNSKILIEILSLIQIIYLVCLIILRPFKEIKANLIEIMNEIYFFLLLGSLIFLNDESDWNLYNTLVYMWVLASNSMTIFIITIKPFVQSLLNGQDPFNFVRDWTKGIDVLDI